MCHRDNRFLISKSSNGLLNLKFSFSKEKEMTHGRLMPLLSSFLSNSRFLMMESFSLLSNLLLNLFLSFISEISAWRLVFWNSIHLEVASDSFCFLLYSSWLLVFILYVFELFFSFINLYCWKGLHFS